MPVLGSHGDAHDVARPSPERLHERHAVVTERQHVGTPILDHRAACRGVVVANCPLCILSSCPVALSNKVARHLLGAGNSVGVQVLDDHRNGDGLNNGAHVHSPGVLYCSNGWCGSARLGQGADDVCLACLAQHLDAPTLCQISQFGNGHVLEYRMCQSTLARRIGDRGVGVTLPACPCTSDRVLLPDHATLAPTLHPGTGVVLVNGRSLETGHCFLLCVWCDCLPHNTRH